MILMQIFLKRMLRGKKIYCSNSCFRVTIAISAASVVWVVTTVFFLLFQNVYKTIPKLIVFVSAFAFCGFSIILAMVFSYGMHNSIV